MLWYLPCALPWIFMVPEVASGNLAHVRASDPDVMGTATLIFLTLCLAVTPAVTITGRKRLIPWRRRFGLLMFVSAVTDITLAVISTPGSLAGRVIGSSFLTLGTIAVLVALPLAATANRNALRRLGLHWKPLQRYGTYAIWLIIAAHLAVLTHMGRVSGSAVFEPFIALSVAFAGARVPWVRRRIAAMRWPVLTAALIALVAFGLWQLGHEECVKGIAALLNRPVD